MQTYTLYWKDGRKETVEGDNDSEAYYNAGHTQEQLKELDFIDGHGLDYVYYPSMKMWSIKGVFSG
jgi:hypothetical protein